MLAAFQGFPVFENRLLQWGAVWIIAGTVYVDSIVDFERRLKWAGRPLPKAEPSREPACAVPLEVP